ncbi:amidohydrolase family protein [Streptomyces sp. NPDC058195]|uniref:amidohydrolase family protein n=1 Tax=Streptomyces sp. NPDC058195 TaxID=3346375 RepID=UPI0036E02BE3
MIDCHVHLWNPADGFPWIRPGDAHHRAFGQGDLERSGSGLGLTGAVLVEASRGDAGETLALRELCLRRPDLVAGYVANLHVHGPAGPDALRALLREPGPGRPNGMRLGGAEWSGTPEEARALVPLLAESGTVLELNLYRGALTAAAEVTARHPGLTVVVDHLGNAPDPRTPEAAQWHRDVERAAASPDVVVKISGLLTQQHGVPPERVAAMVRHVVDTLGPDRCLVGSDWPICLPRGTRADSLAASRPGLAHLTQEQRRSVLHTTAVRVYGLAG